jgi:hypothetical protein
MSMWESASRPMIYLAYGGVKLHKHADYPHRAGELYDCHECENTCYCTDTFSCLACELEREALQEEC